VVLAIINILGHVKNVYDDDDDDVRTSEPKLTKLPSIRC